MAYPFAYVSRYPAATLALKSVWYSAAVIPWRALHAAPVVTVMGAAADSTPASVTSPVHAGSADAASSRQEKDSVRRRKTLDRGFIRSSYFAKPHLYGRTFG